MRNFILPIILIAGICYSLPLQATHIIGGEIRYQCLGNNQYKIILDVYRDCFYGQAPFDHPAHISVYNDNGAFVNNLNLPVLFSDTVLNNIAGDPCLFPPSDVCVEHARYEGVFTLNQPGGFYFVYQRCCRNQTIQNILNPIETGATYFVYLSPVARQQCNSSPAFGFYPPVFVCINKPIKHPHAGTDPNGDSLVYKFYTPFKGATITEPQPPFASPPPYDTVVWKNPPYRLTNLLGGGNPLAIHPQTGLITGLPSIQGQFVVGVSVEEYRNGVLMSIVRRDFQYNVGMCEVIDPAIVAPPAQCDNLTVNFGNETQVAQNFKWYFNWPDTTFSSTQKTPSFTYPDTGTYVIALVAAPGNQCEATGFDTVFLQNNSLIPDFSFQTFDCTDQSVLVLQDLSVDNVSPPIQWNWAVTYGSTTQTSTQQNPTFQIPAQANGNIRLTVRSKNGCEQVVTKNFTTGANNPVSTLPGTLQICLGQSAQLNPNNSATGFTYKWGPPVPANQQNLANPTVTPLQTTTYQVTITGFNNLCQSTANVQVVVNPLPVLAFEADTDCDARVVHFINQSTNSPAGFRWDFGDPTTTLDVSTQTNPTYTYPALGNYRVTLMTAPNALCKDTITQDIILSEKKLQANFDFNYTNCNENEVTIRFFDQSLNNQFNTAQWSWQFAGAFNGTSAERDPVINVTQSGNLTATLTVTTAEGCQSAVTPQALNVNLTKLPGLINDQALGCLNGGVVLNPGGNTNYIYQWSPATGLSCNGCPDPAKVASPLANPSQTTTYTVRILNISADTCDLTRTVTVNVPQNVGLVASNDVLTCNPQTTLTATSTLQPVTFAWFRNNQQVGSGSSLTVTVSGNVQYIARATDQFGCHYFDPVNVAGGPVNISVSGDQIICSNEALNVSAVNLDPNDVITWKWTPASGINGPNNVPAPNVIKTPGERVFHVEATNQFGCKKSDSVYVAVVDENIQLDFDFQVGCSGSVVEFSNLSTNAFNYVWDFGDPTTTEDISTETNPSYNYTSNGTYTVMLTIGFDVGCRDTVFKEVTITDPVFIPNFSFEYLGCTENSIDVQFHDTSVNFLNNTNSWLWTTSTGQTSTLRDPIFTVFSGQEFIITMNIGTPNGCHGSATKSIKLDFPQITFPDTLVLCQGDSLFVNPSGNTSYRYQWSPAINMSNPNSHNPQVWPTETTTYTADVTFFFPDTCTVTRKLTVFVPEKISVTASEDTFTCGTAVTVGASSNIPNAQYKWQTSNGAVVGMQSMLSVLPSSDTWYYVEATDQYGCSARDSVFIANEVVNITMPNLSPECPLEEIQLTTTNLVADHNLSYQWSASAPGQIIPPANGPIVTVLTPPAGQSSTYSVTATNQHGCTATLMQNIATYNFVPTVIPNIQVCPGVGEPINPGANPNLTYSWSPATGLSNPNSSNPTVNILQTTNYTVTVSNNFGTEACQKVIQVEAFAPPVIDITETVDTFTCGSPIVIAAQTTVSVVSLQWSDLQGNALGTGPNLWVNPAAANTYIVKATDSFECFKTDTVKVANNQLDILLDGNGVIDTCPMPSYNVCLTNLDPNDHLTFQWTASNGGQILGGADTACPEITSQQGVTSVFTVSVSNQWGCSATKETKVTTYTFDPVIRDVITICPGVATPINPAAANSTLSYNWSPQMGLSCYDCPNPQATLMQNQLYQVSILGYNGADTCSIVQTVQVKVTPVMNLAVTPATTSICDPEEVTLTVMTSSGIITNYRWSEKPDFTNIFANERIVTVLPQATQTYFVMATDTLGCTSTAQATVNAYPISTDLADRYNFCEDEAPLTIVVGNNNPGQDLSFQWSPTQFIQEVLANGSIIVLDIPDTTEFTAIVKNQFGCVDTLSTTVFYYDIEPTVGQVTSSEDTIIFNSGEFSQFDITFDPTYEYEWVPQNGLDNPFIHNPKAAPDKTTTYKVIVTNEVDCVAEREVTLVVINPDCEEPNIFIPNAFTPNGDGQNDVLYVRSNIIDELEFAVYNRWGQKVFETTDKNTGWDGTFKGELLTPDVYGFYVRANCYNGQLFFKKGNVTLLR